MGTAPSALPFRARSMRLVAAAMALALAGFVGPGASRAHAEPAQPWLGLAALQSQLATSPAGISGSFKTVVGGSTVAQQDPVRLPLTVLGVIANAGPSGPLILLKLDLTDPVMKRIGNIAGGMSGSPVYVPDAGVDKLVGALSYGDIFTTDGLALATPVEDMKKVEELGLTPPAPALQETPRKIPAVRVQGRTISKIVVGSPDNSVGASSPSAAASDTAYFQPLLGVQIGGLPVNSSVYKRLASDVAKRGLAVLAPRGGGVRGDTSDFQTPVVPGASAGTFLSLGDLNVGGIGTVTYTTPSGDALAFGHPLLWNGASSAFFTNAWIDGVWSNSLSSYKLGTPGRIQGTLVQDRGAAVSARVDGIGPDSVPVTSTAIVSADGRDVTQSGVTQVAPVTFATDMHSDLVAAAVVQPVYRAADIAALPGSAETDLRVSLTAGTENYEVHRTNLFDDGGDVQSAPAAEIYTVLDTLFENPDGTTPVTIRHVEMTNTISSARRSASVVGITSPGLRTGANTIQVVVRRYGSTSSQLVPVTLNLPAGTPLTGVVTATGDGSDTSDDGESGGSKDDTSTPLGTIAARVAALNGGTRNSDVSVTFTPEGSDKTFTGVAHTSYVVTGSHEAAASQTVVEPSASPIVAGQAVTLAGAVAPAAARDTVKVERRTAGSTTWTTLRGALALRVEDGEGSFQIADRPLSNSVYRVTYAGSGGSILGSSASVGVTVRGRVTLTGSATKTGFVLSSSLLPKVAGSTITFQVYSGGKWRSIKAVKTNSAGQATVAWKAKKGTYPVRAVLTGTATLAGNVSATVRVRR